jgi:MT0933-like antitoxin protein
MGLLDDVKKVAGDVEDKARTLIDQNGDKIEAGIDKLANLAKGKAGPQYAEKIQTRAAKAKETVKKFGKPGDSGPGDSGPADSGPADSGPTPGA